MSFIIKLLGVSVQTLYNGNYQLVFGTNSNLMGYKLSQRFPMAQPRLMRFVEVLRRLIADKGERRRLGLAARGYVEKHCAPDKVSDAYLGILGHGSHVTAHIAANEAPKSEIAPEWALNYLMRRMVDVLPNSTGK